VITDKLIHTFTIAGLVVLANTLAASGSTIVLIDGTDNAGSVTDGDGYTLNGSFETLTDTKPTYWEAYPGLNHGDSNQWS